MQKLIIALVILSLISGENCIIGTDLLELLKSKASLIKVTYPVNYSDHIKGLYSTGQIITGTIPKRESLLLQQKYGLPMSVVNYFVNWLKTTNTSPLSFDFIIKHTGLMYEYIGAGIIEGDNYRYAIIVAHAGGDLVPKMAKYIERVCTGWWVFKKCRDEEKTKPRGQTVDELEIVTKTIKARLREVVQTQINLNDDVEIGDEPEQETNFLA